ncbi:hypothetical protein LTR17_004433 [Elasticomyces elasticus]|nr:hypothetical protein LTR17_004433 [Elasticomyces elasticus]
MPSSSIRPAKLHAGGLHPIDEEDRMQPSVQSSEDENTAAGGQSRFICERCGQEFTQKRSLTRHQQRTKRCADAGLDSRAESCGCCDPPKSFARADTRRLHETRKRRKLQRIDPVAAIRNDRRTEVLSSVVDQYGRLSDVNSNIVSRGMHEPGHASLVGELARELDETGHLDLMRDFDFASGENCGSRSRSLSSEGHDSGIELQPGILEVGLASPYENSGTDHAPAAGFFVPLASVAESVPRQATMDEAMKQGGVDILQYDWQRDPEEYLLINLDELVGTQMVSLDGDDTMIWQYEPGNPHERPTASTSDAVSVRSTSSRRSTISIPGRFLASVLRSPSSTPRGRNNKTLKAQRCSVCKKPYEHDIVSLRAHLGRHVDAFGAAGTIPTCDICEIGFASQHDLDWHIHNAKRGPPSQCCGLPAGHEQPCKGYRCGFDFKHDRPCNGHHPPSDGGLAWTEYDRFKFGQFLRKWEGTQMRVAAHEAGTVEVLRSFQAAFDNLSLPELRRLSGVSWISKISKTSKVSGRSEPIGHAFDMQELQDRLDRMDLDGLSVQLRRNARRLAGTQKEVDDKLLDAVSASNMDTVLSLLRRGARPGAALSVAVERYDGEMIEILLRAGAHPDLGMLYTTVYSGQAAATKQLLNNRGYTFTASHGAILLQLAIRSADPDTLLAILSYGVEVDQKPTEDQLEEHKDSYYRQSSVDKTVDYPAHLTRDTALCVAARMGHDWAITCLLDAGANPDTEGVEGTALAYAIMYPDCVAALLSGVNHVRYERCWSGFNAIDLAVASCKFSVVETLLDRCRATDDLGCGHGKSALTTYLQVPSTALLEVLVACRVDINDAINDYGQTTLHVAVRTHMEDAVLAGLLCAGADLCKTDTVGYTALDHAIRTRNTRAIRLLLDAGAGPFTKGYHALLIDDSSFPESEEDDDSSFPDPEEDVAIIGILAASNLDANFLDPQGHTPLYRACQQNRTMMMDALLQAGANPTCGALHVAIAQATPNLQCIQILVDAGADLNELSDDGRRPWKLAADHLRAETLEQPTGAGADLNGLSTQGLHWLMYRKFEVRVAPLLRTLFAHGFPPLESVDRDGKSLLHHAAANNDVESILVLGVADSYTDRAELNTLWCDVDRTSPYLLRVTMSPAILAVFYSELAVGKYRPAQEPRIDQIRRQESLSTRYAVCEALLRFQPPGLFTAFTSEVIMVMIEPDNFDPTASNEFIELLLQKTCSKLTPELTVKLVTHAIACSSATKSGSLETVQVLLDFGERSLPPMLTLDALKRTLDRRLEYSVHVGIVTLLLRQCEDKAELSSLCTELLRDSSEDPSSFDHTKYELSARAILIRCMAEQGFDSSECRYALSLHCI